MVLRLILSTYLVSVIRLLCLEEDKLGKVMICITYKKTEKGVDFCVILLACPCRTNPSLTPRSLSLQAIGHWKQ
jgi:hypothetical protein